MSITKLQIGLAVVVVGGGGAALWVQAEAQSELRREIAAAREDNRRIVELRAENERLTRTAIEVEELRQDDARLAQVQQEAAALQTRLDELAKREAEARRRTAAATVADVYRLDQLDQTPAPRFQARPQYPPQMRQAGIGGEVVVEFVVDEAGEVQRARALRSSRKEFEAAAVEAVSKWKFKPGRKDQREVAALMEVPVVFTVADQPPPAGASPESFRVETTPTRSGEGRK